MYANTKAPEMAGGVDGILSSIGKPPGPLGADYSPVFARFRSPVATPCDGSLPKVFSPPPAVPSRWMLDERGSAAYHDLLLQWPHHEHLSELSRGRTAFQRARTDIYPLAYAASVLELNHSHDEHQVRAAAARASVSSRYTIAHIAEQLEVVVTHLRMKLPPSEVTPPSVSRATTGDTAPAVPNGGQAGGVLDDAPGTRPTTGTGKRRHGPLGTP